MLPPSENAHHLALDSQKNQHKFLYHPRHTGQLKFPFKGKRTFPSNPAEYWDACDTLNEEIAPSDHLLFSSIFLPADFDPADLEIFTYQILTTFQNEAPVTGLHHGLSA